MRFHEGDKHLSLLGRCVNRKTAVHLQNTSQKGSVELLDISFNGGVICPGSLNVVHDIEQTANTTDHAADD